MRSAPVALRGCKLYALKSIVIYYASYFAKRTGDNEVVVKTAFPLFSILLHHISRYISAA